MLWAMMMLGYRLWKSSTSTGEVYSVDCVMGGDEEGTTAYSQVGRAKSMAKKM